MQRINFRCMDEDTPKDYALLNRLEDKFVVGLPERIIAAQRDLEHSLVSYQISRLEHSLQSGTRAERDGADIEMTEGALIHDLGDDLAPLNHSNLPQQLFVPM